MTHYWSFQHSTHDNNNNNNNNVYIYIYILLLLLGRIRPKWPFDLKLAAHYHASSTVWEKQKNDTREQKQLLNELKIHNEIICM